MAVGPEQAPDPKEIKILSDILALVLDEQAGHATTALERLRQRATQDGVTGGALKNLFGSLVTARQRSQSAEQRESRLHQQITTLERRLAQSERDTRSAQHLLSRCQMDVGMLQIEIATTNHQKPWRYAAIVVGVAAGLLLGIAMTQFYHSLTAHAPIDRAAYLH